MARTSRGKRGASSRARIARPNRDASARRHPWWWVNAALVTGLIAFLLILLIKPQFEARRDQLAEESSDASSSPVTSPVGDGASFAATYCGSCHAFPEPDILARDRWPRMVEHMNAVIDQNDLGQTLSSEEIERVSAWYAERAPEQVRRLEHEGDRSPLRFEPEPFGLTRMSTASGGPPIIGEVRITDLNQDGERDVLISDIGNGVLSRAARDADGTWQERPLAEIEAPAQIAVDDVTGNGHLDIAVANLGTIKPTDDHVGSVALLVNRGGLDFVGHVLLDNIPRVSDVEIADLNGNGRLDILYAAFGLYQSGHIGWLEQQENGRFENHTIYFRNGASHVRVTDLTGNGRPDFVALVSQEHQEVLAFVNHGEGSFERHLIHKAPHPMWGYSSLELVDFEGDGRHDLLLANGDVFDIEPEPQPFHGVQWIQHHDDLEFTVHDVFNFYGAYRAIPADLTGNGHLDIVVPSMANHWEDADRQSIIWLENTGGQEFTPRRLTSSPTSQVTVAIGDLTSNGWPDILSGGMYVAGGRTERIGRVTLWRNLGPTD